MYVCVCVGGGGSLSGLVWGDFDILWGGLVVVWGVWD